MEFLIGGIIGLATGVVIMGVTVVGAYNKGLKTGGKKHD